MAVIGVAMHKCGIPDVLHSLTSAVPLLFSVQHQLQLCHTTLNEGRTSSCCVSRFTCACSGLRCFWCKQSTGSLQFLDLQIPQGRTEPLHQDRSLWNAHVDRGGEH